MIYLKRIKYEVIYAPLAGQLECGDQYLIKELPDFTLLAVADGLGHGDEAAFAAKKALNTVAEHVNDSIEDLFKQCNQALLNTRGAAMTITRIDINYKLTYLGIGNVMGVCWQLDENSKLSQKAIFLERGIVGSRLPAEMQVREIVMAVGDTFILATDGIKTQFQNELPKLAMPDKIAQRIFNTYRNTSDDGLVLVAQLL